MSLTAVLFAGGLSRRMGADKAVQCFAGQPLWQRQLDLLKLLHPEIILVSARSRPGWCPAEIEVVPDGPPSCGPLSGLAAVLTRLRTTHLLALAIDMPGMTGEHLGKLRAMAQPGKGVVPKMDDFFEPLAAVYPAEAVDLAVQALAQGEHSLQALAQKLVEKDMVRSYDLSQAERECYLNVNTPDDLK